MSVFVVLAVAIGYGAVAVGAATAAAVRLAKRGRRRRWQEAAAMLQGTWSERGSRKQFDGLVATVDGVAIDAFRQRGSLSTVDRPGNALCFTAPAPHSDGLFFRMSMHLTPQQQRALQVFGERIGDRVLIKVSDRLHFGLWLDDVAIQALAGEPDFGFDLDAGVANVHRTGDPEPAQIVAACRLAAVVSQSGTRRRARWQAVADALGGTLAGDTWHPEITLAPETGAARISFMPDGDGEGGKVVPRIRVARERMRSGAPRDLVVNGQLVPPGANERPWPPGVADAIAELSPHRVAITDEEVVVQLLGIAPEREPMRRALALCARLVDGAHEGPYR